MLCSVVFSMLDDNIRCFKSIQDRRKVWILLSASATYQTLRLLGEIVAAVKRKHNGSMFTDYQHPLVDTLGMYLLHIMMEKLF